MGTLGFAPDPLTGQMVVPHPATVRRLLARLDGDALDAAIGAFLSARTARTREPDTLRPIAVDGKTVRGSRTRTTAAVSLLAAMTHSGEVLAQRQVADKSNEIPSFAPLLDGADLTHAVITADALHTQHGHGTYLRSRGAHYIAVVKKNHPGLFDRVRTLPWREITLDHYERTRAHHRDEIRRLKTAAFAHLDYPDARQALQVVRWRRDLGSGKLTIDRWAAADHGRRFDDLFNLVCDPATLLVAFERVAGNKGARTPGVDGFTVVNVERELGLPGYLEDLQRVLTRQL